MVEKRKLKGKKKELLAKEMLAGGWVFFECILQKDFDQHPLYQC